MLSGMTLSTLMGVPYDTSMSINLADVDSSHPNATQVARAAQSQSWSGLLYNSFLRAGAIWDGVFFLHIAEFGYSFEQMHAFFPGLPLAIRFLG